MKKNNTLIIFILSLCLTVFSPNIISAQTQAEIEAMQNEGSDTKEEEVKEKVSKEEKQAIKDAEKAEKAATKAKKDAEKASIKAQKELDKKNAEAKKNAEKANLEAEKAIEKAEKESKKETEASKKAVEETEKTLEKETQTTKKEVEKKKVKVEKEDKKKKVKEPKTKEKPAKSTTKKSTPTRTRSSNVMNKPLKTWSVDVGLNVTTPQTDIRYNDFFGTINPKNEFKYGGQLRVTKMFDNAIGIQLQFAYNRLTGVYDTLVPYKEDRRFLENAGISEGLYFRNNVIQGSVNFYWNISNTVFNINRYYRALHSKKPMKKRWFSFYAYTGIGFSIFDPHVMRLKDDVSVEDPNVFPGVEFQTDRTTEVMMPLALGAKVKISKTIDLGLEYGWNFIFSDKLDGFNYNHPGRIKTDAYNHASLVLTVKLGGKKNSKEHIEWTNAMEPVMEEIAKIGELEKKVNKLAKDEDEDGVSDYFDSDTETPEGATVGADGRVLDIDRDGVADDNDMEMFTGNGAEVDEQGRAIDTDGDGVPDYMDEEDGTSNGKIVNFQGKSLEDHLGTKKGGIKNLALPSIFFDTDKSNIKREFESELFQMALTIKRNEGLSFVLEGHCDERGSDEYNIELGKKRAESVREYLVKNYKLDPSLFEIVSKGRAEVLSPRYNVNRRVDILVVE